jgi:hypothetical protein
MKKLAILTATALLLGYLGLVAYAQRSSSPQSPSAQSSASSMPMGSGMMGRNMMGSGTMGNMGNGTMMSHYWSMMHNFGGEESPMSILAFQDQLQLTGRQEKELRDIQEHASEQAKNVLTKAQLKKYESYMQSSSMHAMMNGQAWPMSGMQSGMTGRRGMGGSMMHGSTN